jgi:hypothetical protein
LVAFAKVYYKYEYDGRFMCSKVVQADVEAQAKKLSLSIRALLERLDKGPLIEDDLNGIIRKADLSG